MKMLLVDDQQHVKIVNLNPTDRVDVVDQFIPCGECGVAILHEYTTHGICHKCRGNTYDLIKQHGWSWEHPGQWEKNFGDRVTVVAGTGEYRFDFTFASANHDHAYGPDWCIDVKDWCKDQPELLHRGCFGPEEMEELEMVYEFLYADLMGDKATAQGDWAAEYGSLHEPDGMLVWNNAFEVSRIHLTQQMLFGVNCKEMTEQQSAKFVELCAIILIWLGKEL